MKVKVCMCNIPCSSRKSIHCLNTVGSSSWSVPSVLRCTATSSVAPNTAESNRGGGEKEGGRERGGEGGREGRREGGGEGVYTLYIHYTLYTLCQASKLYLGGKSGNES